MSEFAPFADLVKRQFDAMSAYELYTVNIPDDVLYATYLASFPFGSNPLFRERTEHDCSCCKNFIRHVGHVVAITGTSVMTVWDTAVDGAEPYATVAKAMRAAVLHAQIDGVFRTSEKVFGAHSTLEAPKAGSNQPVKTWHHFHCSVAKQHRDDSPAEARGHLNTSKQVMERGLNEISVAALDTIIDLVNDNLLYRGGEYIEAVRGFRDLKRAYECTATGLRDIFLWGHLTYKHARFRNTVMGTLALDLSAGVSMEGAVASYESKVAPENYKRPKALITPRMVEDAMKVVDGLGLEASLARRHARVADISVGDVLFVDNTVRGQMKGGVANILMAEAVKAEPSGEPTPVDAATFVSHVLPTARAVEVKVTNDMLPNFMTLTAPVDAAAPPLFKWDNNFAWSYEGGAADSIKERVRSAGGTVDAALRVSLAWSNYDDLDLHVVNPRGEKIFFGDRQDSFGGYLDVDMNAGSGTTRKPVENIRWKKDVPDGLYKVAVNQYCKRENVNGGFSIEIAAGGRTFAFLHDRVVRNSDTIHVATVWLDNGVVVEVTPGREVTQTNGGTDKWGVKTQEYVHVDTIMRSPNYWGDKTVGNPHMFFILHNCRNPEPVRGLFNEFLRPELEKHRKVFEVLGAKMTTPYDENQLSGVGFSNARQDTVDVLVTTDSARRKYRVTF